MSRVEEILGMRGLHEAARLHGVGDIRRYNSRMAAVEFAIEHDDGQSVRALEKADVILLAPSRCGKTPTSMYLALQHGLFVANYPLVDEDLERTDLPDPVREHRDALLRADHHRRAAQPGPQRAAARLALRLGRAVPLGAAPGQRHLRRAPDPGDRLLRAVGRGDVDRDRPDPHQEPEEGTNSMSANVRWFSELGMADLEQVGGKNASLGEMVSNLAELGVQVPDGFATTADAYHRFIGDTGLAERITGLLDGLDTDDVRRLAEVGKEIRDAVVEQPFPADLEADIRAAYDRLVEETRRARPSFAVRSWPPPRTCPTRRSPGSRRPSSTCAASTRSCTAIREVFASLYNDRAIAYRVHHGFDHDDVALSAGVQRMVRSDIGASGVMFTMDTESGFDDAVFITSAYGLGEGVVQGAVNPDEFYVYKPALRAGRPAILKRGVGDKATKMVYTDDATVGRTTEFVDVDPAERRRLSLTDDEVEELARHALVIEEHYGRPMDIEWGKDGVDGGLYILQARPETVQSRATGALERFKMDTAVSKGAEVLVEGRAIGQKIGAGAVRVLTSVDQMHEFVAGEVLVADMTDPDWEPIMKRAAAIVTNRGGRTCHAAIIARELGIPAVVGTGTATKTLADGHEVTVSCAEGDTGLVYDGLLDFTVERTELDEMPDIPVKIMMNVGTPDQAFAFSRLPHRGVGLARLEFIINRQIGIHPKALLELEADPTALDDDLRARDRGHDRRLPQPARVLRPAGRRGRRPCSPPRSRRSR